MRILGRAQGSRHGLLIGAVAVLAYLPSLHFPLKAVIVNSRNRRLA
jgi:hypothetical protein